MKTKKSLSLILALVMVFVMASGALAANAAKVQANGVSESASGDISAEGDSMHGLWARNSGDITYIGGTITTDGNGGYGAFAHDYGKIIGSGKIITNREKARGMSISKSSDITWTGDIETKGEAAHGANIGTTSFGEIKGNIVTYGKGARALIVSDTGNITQATMYGSITTYGDEAYGFVVAGNGSGYLEGDIVTNGEWANGAAADGGPENRNADLQMKGNITTYGENAYAVGASRFGTATITGGTLTVADDDRSYSLFLGNNGIINLVNVTAEGERLLACGRDDPDYTLFDSSGILNVSNASTIAGDILHRGTVADTLEVNLADSVWSGAAEASGDIGVIEINLENSQWNVTGDTNTNGKVTADSDSKVDFNGTTDNITVIVDRIAGDPGLNVKPGDKLIIKNPAGSVESSNPDVIEVITNDDGSIEIVFNGDGEADLTYEYIDENGKIQTGTVKVVSGAGSVQASSSGGSSNCNTGVGAALFALLGLALIQKRK